MTLPFSFTFIVLSGMSGSGKTRLLEELELSGFPTLNLEKVASHRGSAFGNLLMKAQPSQEEFEKEIDKTLQQYPSAKYIFTEQKSSSIGKRKIPAWLYSRMQQGIFIQLQVEKRLRIQNIIEEYQAAGKPGFSGGLQKLKQRLPENVIKQCEDELNNENYEAFVSSMLDYYDNSAKYHVPANAILIKTDANDVMHLKQQVLESLERIDVQLNGLLK